MRQLQSPLQRVKLLVFSANTGMSRFPPPVLIVPDCGEAGPLQVRSNGALCVRFPVLCSIRVGVSASNEALLAACPRGQI